ncbi:MAG: DUF2807 domain-containing protein [Myxococcaceae bacterium]|nr:DUF2807 domain-containing protein [Myxococcaceae bacterium]
MRRLLFATLLLSCGTEMTLVDGNGVLATEERTVPGVTAVALATSGNLTVRFGSPASVSITAEENVLPRLTSTVRGGELGLGSEPFVTLRLHRPISYLLTVPELRSVTVSSSGSVTTPSLAAPTIAFTVSSSGSIVAAGVEANTLKTSISSSGDVRISSGAVASHRVTISSSGSVIADGLRSTSATVTLSSSGDALVWVTDTLDATLSSAGNVRYYGSPMVNVTATSAGRAIPLGAR